MVVSSFVFSAIDDCKTDVYFGNGILTEDSDAKDNAYLLEESIKQKFGLPYFNKKIGKVDYAYNETHEMVLDGLESALQKFDWDLLLSIISSSHGRDLDRQVKKYKNSIM